jgi:hypothetical protein
MKIATIFCFSNRLPNVAARPFSLRTFSCETARIVSWEGISPGLARGIGFKVGEERGFTLATTSVSHTKERRDADRGVTKFSYPLIDR